ncbi:autophagy-related protein 23 [[Candida] anglica]|uniref:Autophagy-related protein 23 n=1 Tax=[Candida] anglica TaxID=148631 RepID=A0ABP0E6I5_9ASCO
MEGEKLSPIRIAEFPTGSGGDHPHGLTAKHDARRNTIHHTVNRTPLSTRRTSEILSMKTQLAPLTSPRTLKYVSTFESIGKSKVKLDARLQQQQQQQQSSRDNSPTNKENVYRLGKAQRTSSRLSSESMNSRQPRSPFESSPTKIDTPSRSNNNSLTMMGSSQKKKRNHEVLEEISTASPSHKIAKVVTNANDLESSFRNEPELEDQEEQENNKNNTSIVIDDVFNKEDLVGQLSSSKPTTNTATTVIDNDSDDSDLEVGRNSANEFSQTMVTKYHTKVPESENFTQQNKILINVDEDYVTPQRLTEPVAKSPEINQGNRVIEESIVENTSPLKSHIDREIPKTVNISDNDDDDEIIEDGIEDEPTINFLMSPNSKPVFSIDHIKKIQNENVKEIESLENIIYHKNQEILKFSEELSSTNGKFLIFDQQIKELTSAKKKLIGNEELLKVQLKHTERDLAKSAKSLKIKMNLTNQLESKIQKYKQQLNSLNSDLELINKEKDNLLKDISELNEKLKLEIENHTVTNSKKIELEEEILSKNKELTLVGEVNLELNLKVESLLKDKEELLTEIKNLKEENVELHDINDKQTSLVEELDKLETLAKNKIAHLIADTEDGKLKIEKLNNEKNDLQVKLDDLTTIHNETQINLDQCTNSLNELTKNLEIIENEKKELSSDLELLQSKYDNSESFIQSLNKKLELFQQENERLKEETTKAKSQIELLKSANKDKDEIISGDTKKMSELVQKVNQQKQKISEYEDNVTSKESNSTEEVNELKSMIKKLQQEIENNNEKTQTRIQEVAEQLYYQYSKKHELKVAEVRKSIEKRFRKQIDHLHIENKSQIRDIESLEKKLEIVSVEKNQLLNLIEEYREVAESDPRKRSPKKGLKRH